MDDSSDTNNELPETLQMKALALFCVAPAKWRMAIAEFDQYLSARARSERTEVLSALESLLLSLANHGGPGVRFWLEKHYENLHGKEKLTKAQSIPAPPEHTKFALTQLPESQWQEYIEQTDYEFKKQRLTVLPPDSKPVVLPKPEFALTITCRISEKGHLP